MFYKIFKKILISIFLIFAFITPTYAEYHINESNVKNGVEKFVEIYFERGMAGAAVEVSSCYDEMDKIRKKTAKKFEKFEYCFAMDFSAYRYDFDISQIKKFPQHEYFNIENLEARLNKNMNEWPLTKEDILDRVQFINQQVYISIQLRMGFD